MNPKPQPETFASPKASDTDTFSRLEDVSIEGYTIEEELGRGGMGVVYRAKHLSLKRLVALKVILTGEHSSTTQRQRFVGEAEAIARLSHPGIVQIYEVGESQGRPYLALELVSGGSLADITEGRPRSVRWSAELVLQLARAVHFAHSHGVVHRDLKPENVLVVPSEEQSPEPAGEAVPTVKITDFGLAKQLDSDSDLTVTGMVMGTPEYMSPEQASGQGRRVGPGSDLHALGAILYELLVGHPPFVSDDVFQTMRMVIEDDPVSPRVWNPDVPPELETVCLKCLMKQPSDRYVSAQDLANDLELYLHGEPILARPLSQVGRLVRWARHTPLLATHYSVCIVFYCLHLFAMFVLKLPQHQGRFHWLATFALSGWALLATFLQRLLASERWRVWGEYAFASVPLLLIVAGFSLDQGPNSAPLPLLLPLVASSALIVPQPRMVWFVTGVALVAYLGLVAQAHWYRPAMKLDAETVIAFVLCLLGMGLVMHLLLRRAHTSIRTSSSVEM